MAEAIYVSPNSTKYFTVKYADGGSAAKRAALEAEWKHFNRLDPASNLTFYIWYRPSSNKGLVTVDYTFPPNSAPGLYRIEVFVPGKYATSMKANFTIANNFRTENGKSAYDESIAAVEMYHLYDQWFPLGDFLIDPKVNPLSGRVRQYDMSLESPPSSITFAPVRWVPLAVVPQPGGGEGGSVIVPPGGGKGYDAPIGTAAERAGFFQDLVRPGFGPVWFGNWFDATPYLSWYFNGYHTGSDLNLMTGSAADKDAPIYATSDGKVLYAGAAGKWGNIIVMEHEDALVTLPDGRTQRQRVFSRYGHVTDKILVQVGQQVVRGTNIGFIGLAQGMTSGWHLHFDIGYSDMLKVQPRHWPNLNQVRALEAANKQNTREYAAAQLAVKQEVLKHYVDPFKFLKDNH